MGTRPWEDQWGVIPDSDSPAVYISWEDAQEFITRVNRLSGSGFRLPTEAEWEYACRAATTSRFYWGDDPEYQEGDAYAWWPATAINAGEAYAHPVGLLEPNPWGLFDMAGNAWEWCQDWYGPYAPGDQTDPTGPSTGTERVGRGGSWGAIDPAHCRSAYRGKNRPDYGGSSGIGFRLVR
jgi:formylglycine-generating enzyme required for sulfatase activity